MNIRGSAKQARNRDRTGGADILVCPAAWQGHSSAWPCLPSMPTQSCGHGTRKIRARAWNRAGFSLLEVLVVIGLIAFLSAAIAVIVPRVANASKVASTRATIKKVDEFLNDRINGFRRYIQTQDKLAGAAGIPSYVFDWGSPAQVGNNLPLAKVLATKYAFRNAFPQRFSEMKTPPAYNSSKHDPVTESAACLYLILTKTAVYDTEPLEGGDLKGFEFADTDGDGLMEVVDAWGHPLRFYRWPTRLIRASNPPTTAQTISSGAYAIPVQPNYPPPTNNNYSGSWTPPTAGLSARLLISAIVVPTPTSTPPSTAAPPATMAAELTTSIFKDLAKDPDDSTGLIQSAMTLATPPFTSTVFEQNYHTPDTYSTPLVVSMGPDGDTGGLGLFEPFDTTNFGYLGQPRTDLSVTDPAGLNALLDNITNHQQ